MYKCEECGEFFEEPREINADIYYGVSGLFDSRTNKTISVCPYCDGNYEEAYECEDCGRLFTRFELDEYNGKLLCDSCIDELQTDEQDE